MRLRRANGRQQQQQHGATGAADSTVEAAAEDDRPALGLDGIHQNEGTAGQAAPGPQPPAAAAAGVGAVVPPQTPGSEPAAGAILIDVPQPAAATSTTGTPPPPATAASPGGQPQQSPRFLRGAKIRWYTFTSQVLVSLMTIAMVMLSLGGQTSMIMTSSVLGNYFPNERLYVQTKKGQQQPAASGAAPVPAAVPAGGTAAAGPAASTTSEADDVPPPLTADDVARELEESDDADISMSFARFFMQSTFAVIILVFCMVQVGRARVTAAAANRTTVLPEENTYLPVITAIHAFCMPPPGTKKAGKG